MEKHDIDLVVHGDDMSGEQMKYLCEAPMSMGIFRTVPYTKGISNIENIRRCKEAKL